MRLPKSIINMNWLVIGGFIFISWGILNTWLSITRYGIEHGDYMWFCNLALFAIGFGLLIQNSGLVISFLSMALLTQSLWIIDNIWRLFAKKNLFGVIEFMYQPGYPLDEFVVSHYHFFIIPFAILALFFLKHKKHKTTKITFISGSFIFFASYLLSLPDKNVNCIKESCLPALMNFSGLSYSLIFPLIILLASSFLANFIQEAFLKAKVTKKQKKFAVFIFCIIFLSSLMFVMFDIQYKKTLPKFICLGPSENNGVKISCKYTTEFQDNQMWFVYLMESKSTEPSICTSKIKLNDKEEILQRNMYIEPKKKYKLSSVFSYPNTDTFGKLFVSCQN